MAIPVPGTPIRTPKIDRTEETNLTLLYIITAPSLKDILNTIATQS
jgi:hypothetical protein